MFKKMLKSKKQPNKISKNKKQTGELGQRAGMAAISTVEVLEGRIAPASAVLNGPNSTWTVSDETSTTNGLPSGGNASTVVAGLGAGLVDATWGSQSDAFDNASMVWINNIQVVGAMTQAGNSVTFAPSTIAGLNVSMRYDVLGTSDTLRNFVSMTNPTGSAITVTLTYATNFGSDGTTTISGTASGDLAFTTADGWLVTDDSGSDPANTTVLFSAGATVTPSSVSQTVFDSAGTQGALANYSVTIPAGATRSLMFFQDVDDTSANALSTATAFNTIALGSPLLAGLSPAQVNTVANFTLGSAYSAEVQSLGPVAYYRLGDTAGPTASDSSGNGNHGTYQNGPLLNQTGRIGGDTAVSFDGSDDHVVAPLSINNTFTISAWINTSQSAASGSQWFQGFGLVDAEVAGVTSDFGTSILNGRFAFGVGATDTTIQSTTAVNDGAWHHVVATRDGTTGQMRIFVDGVEENSASGPTGVRTAPTRITIGELQTNIARFAGRIDEVALFNTALSPAQVSDLYASAFVGSATTELTLAGGALTITDIAGGDTNDALTFTINGANLRISDAGNQLGAGAGMTQIDGNTVEIPLASITAGITLNTLGGDDTVTLNLGSGDLIPAGGLIFNGGAGGNDSLIIQGGSQGLVTYNYTNATDGNIVMQNFGTVTYTGLDPITNTGTATDIVFNLPAGPNTVTLADDGNAGNNLSRLSGATFELTDFANPTGSITINRGNAADTLTVNALPNLNSSIVIGSGANPFAAVTFNGSITLGADKSLAVQSSGTISLSGAASDLATSGTGSLSLVTTRNIVLNGGSSLTSTNGNISLSANAAGSTVGAFVGINASGSTVSATGTGVVSLLGVGGDNSGSNLHGILLTGGTLISGGTAGANRTIVTGIGGDSAGDGHAGVVVTNATVTSAGGNVVVTGTGGTLITSGSGSGVILDSASALLTAGGTGSVTVSGTGGNGNGSTQVGVDVRFGARISSSGGNVAVTGTGGSNAGGANPGVRSIIGSVIEATGTGSLTVLGTAGAGANIGSIAVVSDNSSATIRTANGPLTVTAISGNTAAPALSVLNASIVAGNNNNLTIRTNSADIGAGALISSGTGTTSIAPLTNGATVNLGGADVLVGSPLALGLTDAELDRFTAGTLNLGISVPAGTINEGFDAAGIPGGYVADGASVAFPGANVVFNGAAGGANRTYVRTLDNSYFTRDFTAEITVTMGTNLAMFGMGTGLRNPVWFNAPQGGLVGFTLHPSSIASGQTIVQDFDPTVNDNGTPAQNYNIGNAGSGTHRMRIVWNATTQMAQAFMDVNYAGGAFISDLSTPLINGADNGFTANNVSIYFGGDAGVVFDNLVVTTNGATTGTVTLAGAVDLTNGTPISRLVLNTASSIVDGNATGQDIRVSQLLVNAPTGFGTLANPIETTVSTLDFTNAAGGIFVANSGALTIGNLDGAVATAAGGVISASSPLTINSSMSLTGNTTFTAGNSAANDDDITISGGAIITLNSANNISLTLNAGDDIIFNTGSITSSGVGQKTVILNADLEGAGGDSDRGGITQTDATVSVTAASIIISAPEGVGSAAQPFRFASLLLGANTSGLNGNQFLHTAGTTNVSNLNAGNGGTTPAAGTINLLNGTYRLVAGDAIGDLSAVVLSATSTLNLNNDAETIGSLEGSGTVDLGAASALYTFGMTSDDGARLRVDFNGDGILNAADDFIIDDVLAPEHDRFSAPRIITAGNYLFEWVYFERGGEDEGELYYAPGSFAAFDPAFRLVGDGSQGIGLTGNFTATTYQQLPVQLTSLAVADSIRLPANIVGTGTFALADFLGFPPSGHFATNNTPPGYVGPNMSDYAVYSTGTISVSGSGTGVGVLTIGGNNASTSFTGSIGSGDTGGIIKTGTGTLTLAGASTYTGATTVNNGTLSITGSIATSAVTVSGTGTVSGSGTTGSITANSTGTLAPGNGIGTLNSGNLTLNSGSIFAAQINGTTPGTQHDQQNVTGTVNINGATLSLSGTLVSNPPQTIVLINNDGADPVVGTFSGLPEGSLISFNSGLYTLSYAGGTGNDVTLMNAAESQVDVTGGNLIFSDINGGVSNDNVTISRNGANIRIFDPSHVILAGNGATQINANTVEVPFASITGNIQALTLAGNDLLTLDFSGGTILPAGGISYVGGSQTTGDALAILGGTTTTVTHAFTNANDGSITLAGALSGTITYTGLEPITDNLNATNRVFTFNGGSESISLVDAAGANMTIDSTLGESVTFANPTTSLTINGGTGDDAITITSMDAAYAGSLLIDGGANTDTITLTSLSTLSALTTTSESIGALPALNIGAGGLSITSTSSAITQTGAIVVSGSTSLNVGANAVTLNNAANNFGGAVSISNSGANNVSVTDLNAIVLGTITVGSGTLGVTAVGITQSGTITQAGAGAVTLSGGAAAITLTGANDFVGTVSASTTSGGISLRDASGGMTVASATTTDGAISLEANAATLTATTVTAGGAGRNVSLVNTGGSVAVGNVTAAGDSVIINASTSVTEAGADGTADITATTLGITAGTSVGVGATIETAVSNLSVASGTGMDLANTGVLTVTGLSVSGAGSIVLTNAGAATTTGAVTAANGAITISAASPLTVSSNMTASGNILLTAGEISDAPVWADDFTLNGGATIQSTGGSVTLRAGDDVILAAGTTVNAATTVDLIAGFGDLDGAGSLSLLGTIIAGGALNFGSLGDIIVGAINAPGQSVTLTADSDGNGTGAVYRDGVAATNVIANSLTVSGSERIANVVDPGPWGVHLVTQVNTLSATTNVTAPGSDAAAIDIVNSGSLTVTNATTNSTWNGSISIQATTGNLTLGGNVTSSNSVSLTATAGDISRTAGTVTANLLTLTAGGADGDIGTVGAPLQTTATTIAFTGTGTGEVAITESNGASVSGSTGSGDINLTVTTGTWTVVNTGVDTTGNVTMTATSGDIIRSGASADITGNLITLTAGAPDGDLGSAAASLLTSATTLVISATDDVYIVESNGAGVSATSVSGLINLTTTTGNWTVNAPGISTTSSVNLTATAGDIISTGPTAVVAGNIVTLVATGADGDVGTIAAPLYTNAATINFTGGAGGDVGIIEANGADVTGTASGPVSLLTTTGNWAIISTGVDTTGTVAMTAAAGDIIRSGASADITGTALTLAAGGGDGDLGSVGTPLLTTATSITFTGTGTGEVAITESNGATVTGSTGSGDIRLVSTTGDLTVVNPGITTTGSVAMTTGDGDILRSGAGALISANLITLNAGGADGDIGVVGTPLLTTGGTIQFAGSGTGEVAINETDGAFILGLTGSGNINLNSATGDWNIVFGGVDTTGNVTMTTGSGDIIRTGASADVTGNVVTLTAAGADGDLGSAANPLLTSATTIAFTGTGTGEVAITETDGANVSGSTGSGLINLLTTTGSWNVINTGVSTTNNVNMTAQDGDLTRTGAGAIVAGNVVTLTAGGADGDIGAPGTALLTTATTINFTATGTGSVDITETNDAFISGVTDAGNTSTNLTAGGTWNLNLLDLSGTSTIATIVAGAGVRDNNGAANNIDALAAVITAATGIGTPADPIETAIGSLEGSAGNGGAFINEANALTIGGISGVNGLAATAGNIIINSGALTIQERIQTPANVTLNAAGPITEVGAGFISANLLTTTSNGGQTLNGPNTVGTFTATNSGVGTSISLENNAAGFIIQTVSNPTGGDVYINNIGNGATMTGNITSGNPLLGGDIFVATAGLLTVNSVADSRGGTGGTLTLSNQVIVNVSPIVGFGNVTLQGGPGTLTINAPVVVTSPLVLTATDDVNVLARVETASVLSDITVLADSDGDGAGGVYLGQGPGSNQGLLKSGRSLDVRGSEYMGTAVPALGFLDNSIILQPNGTTPRLEAVSNILVKNNGAAGVGNRIWLGSLVRSNTNGDVAFDDAVLVTNNLARVQTHGGGDVIFLGAVDSGAGGPFDLRVSSSDGVVLFNGPVGQVSPLRDVTVDLALDVTVAAAFTARTFTVTNATGTVDLSGPVTTTGATTNLNIIAENLLVNAPVDATVGNINFEVNTIAIGDTVAGAGTLTIQPRDVARTIGVNGAGDLNIDSTEIGLLQNGFSQIFIGRSNGTGLITVGERILPDSWLDPVQFRSPASGGQIDLVGQLAGTDNAAFSFQAPRVVVNVVGTPTISTTGGAVTFGSLTLNSEVILQSDLTIQSGPSGDVTFIGTINGNNDLLINAGTGTVFLNGNTTGVPTGSSIGGTTALASVDVTGGTLLLRPNIRSNGPQSYTGTDIQLIGGAFRTLNDGTADIAFNGNVTLQNNIAIGTTNSAIEFNGNVNNVAAHTTSAGKGALRLDTVAGEVLFGGNVGNVFAPKTIEITSAGLVTLGNDAGDTFIGGTSVTMVTDELDMAGDVSVPGGLLSIQTRIETTGIVIGGAETLGSPDMELSATDVAALGDGTASILIGRRLGNADITVAGPATFNDPVIFQQPAKVGGATVVNAALTGATANGGFTFNGPATRLNANITTAGGSVDIENAVGVGANTIIDTSAGGGNVTFRGGVLGLNGGEDITVNAGTGTIHMNTGLKPTGANLLGTLTLNNSGVTRLDRGLTVGGLVVDGGGVTYLKGLITTTGIEGQTYNDPVQVIGSSDLRSTNSDGSIHFTSTIDSNAATPTKRFNLSITNRAVPATGMTAQFDGAIGATVPLGVLRVNSTGDASFGPAADVTATSVSIRARNFTMQDVVTTSSQTYTGIGTYNGVIDALKLSISTTADITNNAPWTVDQLATLAAKGANISITGAGNTFGELTLRGVDATIEEAGNMVLRNTALQGTLNVTTTSAGLENGDLNQGSSRTDAVRLEANIAGALNFIRPDTRIREIGSITGDTINLLVRGPRYIELDGPISANGDIVLAASTNGTIGSFITGGNNVAITSTTGRFVVYSYYAEYAGDGTNLAVNLPAATVVSNTLHPGAVPGGNVIAYYLLRA